MDLRECCNKKFVFHGGTGGQKFHLNDIHNMKHFFISSNLELSHSVVFWNFDTRERIYKVQRAREEYKHAK